MDTINWDRLKELMEQQTGILEELLAISRSKQTVLLSGDIQRLNEFVKREEQLVFVAGQVEQERVKEFSMLAKKLSLPETATLRDLAEHCSPGMAEFLDVIGGSLSTLIGELQQVNGQNIELINQSLDLIQFTIESIAGTQQEPTFGYDSIKPKSSLSFLVDKKI